METKVRWVLVGAFVQEPVCRRQGGPVASGPGGRPVSATAGFLLGRAVNLNGVLPHRVFLLLEDPGGGEGGGSAAEELLGWTQPRKSIRDSAPSLPWRKHRCTTVICKARVVSSMDPSQHLLQSASPDALDNVSALGSAWVRPLLQSHHCFSAESEMLMIEIVSFVSVSLKLIMVPSTQQRLKHYNYWLLTLWRGFPCGQSSRLTMRGEGSKIVSGILSLLYTLQELSPEAPLPVFTM